MVKLILLALFVWVIWLTLRKISEDTKGNTAQRASGDFARTSFMQCFPDSCEHKATKSPALLPRRTGLFSLLRSVYPLLYSPLFGSV